MNFRPCLSIVCVTFNCVNTLSETLESFTAVKKLIGSNVEIIVVDGNSADGTVELIEAYSNSFDVFVSEPDAGIYDAMNKGVSLACGKWLLFINDGDRLFDIRGLLEHLSSSDAVLVSGAVELSSGELFKPALNWRTRINNTFHHQGTCYRKSDLIIYDTRLRVFSDFDLNQKLVKAGKSVDVLDICISYHSLEGVSHNRSVAPELFQVVKRNYGVGWMILSFIYMKYRGVRLRCKKLLA